MVAALICSNQDQFSLAAILHTENHQKLEEEQYRIRRWRSCCGGVRKMFMWMSLYVFVFYYLLSSVSIRVIQTPLSLECEKN